MTSTLKGKIIVFFLCFIGTYFLINIIIDVIYIHKEKRENLQILLAFALNDNYIYIHEKQENTDLNFLYNLPHMISVLESSGARQIEFFFSATKYIPKRNEIVADLRLDSGYYFNIKSIDREIKKHIYESIVILLALDFAFLILLSIAGVYFIHKLFKPLSSIAKQCKNYKDGNVFKIDDKNSSSEITQLQSALNALVHRFGELRKKDKEYFEHATHEFKTPLAIIKARVDSYKEDKNAKKDTFVTEINGDIERLYLEVKSMLFFNIFDFEEKEYISVREEIEAAAATCEPLLVERNLSIEICGEDFYLFSRKKIFAKMFMSIFENAIIYAKSDSKIHIFLSHNALSIENVRGSQINLFSSKLGITILEKLSSELAFRFEIAKDDENYRVNIYFD